MINNFTGGQSATRKTNKGIFSAILTTLALTTAIYGCSPAPNSTSNNQSGMSAEANVAFSSMYSNEQAFQDSEAVADSKQGFNTKALDLGLDTTIGADLKTRLDQLTSQLTINSDVSADLVLRINRPDFTVRSSNVVTINNNDGSTAKFLAVEFTGKTSGKTETDKLSNTFSANGSAKLEHYLTANAGGYNKIAVRTENNSNSSQKTVETKSTASLSNGSSIIINETRTANNGLQGSGTISITSAGGTKTNYTFDSNVGADGKLTVNAKNTADNTVINLSQQSDTTATANITSNGQASTSQLKTDFSSESSVSAS
jgi:hypothetical protein